MRSFCALLCLASCADQADGISKDGISRDGISRDGISRGTVWPLPRGRSARRSLLGKFLRRWLHGLHEIPWLQGIFDSLGFHAAAHLPIADGELDGGADPWQIFLGTTPEERPEHRRSEAFVPANPTDPVGKRCAPGDVWGSWYYNVTAPALVPFIVPAGAPGRTGAGVIVLPGGGRQFLAWHKEGTRIAKWLNSVGISAFVLKYRVPSNPKGAPDKALIDAQRAVSLVRQKAAALGLSKVGMIGFSAGGGIISEVSCTLDRKYAHVDAADTLSHVPDFMLNIYGGGPSDCPNQNMPPTFMAVAIDDQCVPHSKALGLFRRIDDMKTPASKRHELHIFGEGRHGYGDCSVWVEGGRFKDVCAWTINAELFIKSVVLGEDKALDGGVATFNHH